MSYEIKELSKIHDIIKSSQSVRIAFPPDEDGYPYILPFTFGFENNTFYFHSNKKGRKLDFFKEQPKVKVGFQLDTDLKLVLGKRSCDCDIKYRSVVGAGIAEL
ncbi:cytoplasmic protein-related [Anaeramoeba flamelloides]|uniref:Cytoplasmic protein-related n=1 Tax=Anaeramoeba flamelloides TaxID=1746091 RepID=A0AAV7Y9Y7_9EUKA|nr:cytoplasmic protein-related [Anaeramoeba flamelloides]